MQAIVTSIQWVTPPQYAQATGLAYQRVLAMCESGELFATKAEGGTQWRIKIDGAGDSVPYEKYELVLQENARLKAIYSVLVNSLKDVCI